MSRIARLLVAVMLLAPAPALAQGSSATLPDLEDEVMCPTCGTTLALSESPQADQIRDQIRGLIAAGLDKDEVKSELIAEYGPEVIAVPQTSGFDLAAWIVPAAGLLIGAVALAIGAHRWRARGRRSTPAPLAVDGPPAAEDEQRLEEDLRRYRL